MKILALDVGGTAIKSAIVQNSIVSENKEIPSEGKLGVEALLNNIFNCIDSYNDYDVIGISSAGQIDSETGYVIWGNDNIPGYTGTKISQIIEEKFKKPVFVENDVNAAALGESNFGAGKNEKNFICLTYGTGIGGAIIIDKQLYKGSLGIAGEIGHIITHPEGRLCTCGLAGCYERYASVTALVREAMLINPKLINGRAIFESFNNNDDKTKEIIDNWINEIIYGLVTIIHIFNPSCILLGGGIMSSEYIIEQINEKIKAKIMNSYSNVKIVSAELGNNAGIYGMVSIINQKYNMKK